MQVVIEMMKDSEFWNQSNWYAIQTKPARESQAAASIRELSLDVFLPETKHVKRAWGKKVVSIKPLFPGYLFACFSPSPYLHPIKYARGVMRVLCAGEVPIPLNKEIIDMLKSRVGEDGFVNIGPGPFKAGDKVVIEQGPLHGLGGIFERELSRGERVIVLLKAIEYQARVFIERRYLRPETEEA
jgi:transcriptional antiterminator RfaH